MRKSSKIGVFAITVAVLIICGIVLYAKLSLDSEYEDLLEQQQRLETQIADEEDRTEEIEEYSIYVKTKKFIMDVARNILGLVDSEDIVIKGTTEP